MKTFQPVAYKVAAAGITPNDISLASVVFAVLAIICLWYGYIVPFVILFALSYVLDTVDGWMARTFSMFSEWGEALDHWTDIAVAIVLVSVVIMKRRPLLPIAFLLVLMYGVAAIGESCIQREIGKFKRTQASTDNTLDVMAQLCPPDSDPHIIRHFSTPTFLAIVGCSLLVYCAWTGHP